MRAGVHREPTRKHRAFAVFLEDESGQDQIEYGLVAALLSLGAVAALKAVAASVIALWQGVATGFMKAV